MLIDYFDSLIYGDGEEKKFSNRQAFLEKFKALLKSLKIEQESLKTEQESFKIEHSYFQIEHSYFQIEQLFLKILLRGFNQSFVSFNQSILIFYNNQTAQQINFELLLSIIKLKSTLFEVFHVWPAIW